MEALSSVKMFLTNSWIVLLLDCASKGGAIRAWLSKEE